MKHFLVLILLSLFFASGVANDKIVVQGTGTTRDGAIKDALKSAVEQKYGMQIATKEMAQMFTGQTSSTVNGKESSSFIAEDSNKIKIATLSKGRIKNYNILTVEKNADGSGFIASLEVVFPGKYIVGANHGNRRRMAVSKFRLNTKTFSVFGNTYSAYDWANALHNAVNTNLTQSRKFTMLDRDFGAEVNQELARLADPNCSPDDTIRLGQKLATDYLVVGTIKFTNVPALSRNPYTGEVIFPQQAIFATVDYRVLLAATGQLKWSDSFKVDAMHFYESFRNNSINDSAEAIAAQLCSGLVSSILPYEIVSVTKNNIIVIGEGGKTFYNGEVLSAFNLGEDVKDSRTGEIIDSIEIPVGMVKIIRITEKLSYAQIISGNPADFKVGARVRRDEKSQAYNASYQSNIQQKENNVSPVVQKTSTGGVVVPF